MTMKNDIFEQILTIDSEIGKVCIENQRRHGWVKSDSKEEKENIQINDTNVSTQEPNTNYENKEESNELTKEKMGANKKKAFRLFAGLRKNTEDKTEEEQQKEDSSQATVAYQPAVANNSYGNTGVTNQVVFTPASDFKTPEERISELYNQLVMETDINKISYITNQIINLVPDKERFMKTLLSKLKGM